MVGNVDEWTRLMKDKLMKLNDVLGCCDRSLCPDNLDEDEVSAAPSFFYACALLMGARCRGRWEGVRSERLERFVSR